MRVRFLLLGLLLVAILGCNQAPSPADSNAESGVRVFQVKGVLQEFPTDGRSAVIRHEEIPNYMPPMTMTLRLRHPEELRGLVRGDVVDFRLVVTDEDHQIDSIRRIGHTNETALTSGASGASERLLRVGDPLPDLLFLGEDGSEHSLAEFRGNTLAFTFLFTRCPLPDFCPRMSKNFNRARALAAIHPAGLKGYQFLSLSFDPAHDTAEVLRQYASGYRGTNADRWQFGVLSTNSLIEFTPRLGLWVSSLGGSLSHNLRTVVVDPRGRIFRLFDGNEWTPEDLVTSMQEAATERTEP